MTGLADGARRLFGRGTDLGDRLAGLERAVEASRGRIGDEDLDDVGAMVAKATERLKLSPDHTVVALAGATGSGKSSTFNALTGLELSAVGIRRPTTSWATACVWGGDDADDLLDWLGIPPRHQTKRDSLVLGGKREKELEGVVLLDLPDHDSTEVSHHLEVARLVKLTDLFIWVVDPQKYADAALHNRFLRRLSTHKDVMLVVLNHIDTVAPDRRDSMLADVRRLLAADGLDGVPVLPLSAREGIGVDELRGEIATRVRAKELSRQRMSADVKAAATRLDALTGSAQPRSLDDSAVGRLDDALADAAGVPVVVRAVEDSTRLRANRATGWPVTSWLSRLRPDPLKRLHLDLGSAGRQLTGVARTSMPEATKVQRARVDTEVRALADSVSEGLAKPWAVSVRRASTGRMDDLNDRLDRSLASTELGVERIPVWAGLVRVLQWVLILTALGGALWLAAIFGMGYVSAGHGSVPDWHSIPIPTLMLVVGIALGLLLAGFCRLLVKWTARSRARRADARLRSAIAGVSKELVVDPVRAELAAYAKAREGLAVALK